MKKKHKIFLFMGPPGSGKGTLSASCVKIFGWYQLSTGNLCRDHIARKTTLGLQIKDIISKGELVSDEIILEMIKEWIISHKNLPETIIFDGYPRTKKQAELFFSLLQEYLSHADVTLVKLNVNTNVVIDRIVSRVSCSNKDCQQVYSLIKGSLLYPKKVTECDLCGSELLKRFDDTEKTIKNRIDVYNNHEREIIDYFVNKGMILHIINGDQSTQDVFLDFKNLAEQKKYVC